MRVTLTGAGGFIGSHLAERLVHEGHEVRALVRYTSRGDFGLLDDLPAEAAAHVDVRAGDLRDPEAVRQVVRGADLVFHLAALIAIPYSYVHPREVVETNVMGTYNVLSAVREFAVPRMVHTSTSEVYGTARQVPIPETHLLQGQSPYSASKIGADKIAESFHLSFQTPVATIRPFNTYGPRQSTRAVIPTIITQAVSGAEQIRLGSLHPTRDLLFVEDTVAGFLAVASSDACVGRVVNVGTGTEISIGELAARILALTGRGETPIVTDQERVRPRGSEVERLICDNRLAAQLTGWRPTVSLDEGLTRTIAWVREHLNRYRAGYQV